MKLTIIASLVASAAAFAPFKLAKTAFALEAFNGRRGTRALFSAIDPADPSNLSPSLLDVKMVGTAADSEVLLGTSRSSPEEEHSKIAPLSMWLVRLNSKLDVFKLKKIFAFFALSSSAVIIGTGVATDLTTIPEWLHLFNDTFMISTFGLCVASARLIDKTRRNEPVARTALSSLLLVVGGTAVLEEFLSPWCPDFLMVHSISIAVFSVPLVMIVLLQLVCISKGAEAIESRKDKNEPNSSPADWFVYIAPLFIAVILSTTSIILAFEFDHQAYWDYLGTIPMGIEKAEAVNYYGNMIAEVAIMLMPFWVTLRDRRLISKGMEQAGILTSASIGILTFAYTVVCGTFPLDTLRNLI